jgi:CubicO group peptidase (beta-lactamase class C family)
MATEGFLRQCQLALGIDGRVVVFETFGDARPATRFTLFSASKPIIAAAVWQLIGDGLVALDTPIADVVPEFASNGKDAVKLAHVLLHTAGFPRQPFDDRDLASSLTRRATFAQWQLEWPPGTRFEYHANTCHWVLAELLETLRCADYRHVVEVHVTGPAGIRRRVLGISPSDQDNISRIEWVGKPNPAVTPGDGIGLSPDMFLRYNDPAIRELGLPAGGAVMTASDLALLYQAFLHNPGQIWDSAILRDATTLIRNRYIDQTLGAPANRTIGFVIGPPIQGGLGRCRFGHGGSGGQVGWADPVTGLSFAFLTSSLDRNPNVWADRSYELSALALECATSA